MRNRWILGGVVLSLAGGCAENSPLQRNESFTAPAAPGGDTEQGTETEQGGGVRPEGPDAGPTEPPLDPETCLPAEPGPPAPGPAPVPAPAAGEPGTVIFSEVMPRPGGGLDEEWIELYNATDDDVDLSGCQLSKDDGDDVVTIGAVTIAGGQYALIAHEDFADAVADSTYGRGFSMGSSDDLVLTCAGTVLDTFSFGDGGADPEYKQSVQLDVRYAERGLNESNDVWCPGTTSMAASDNQGTPGAANVECAVAAPPTGEPATDPEPEPAPDPMDECATSEPTDPGTTDPGTTDPGPDPGTGSGGDVWTCKYTVFGSAACVDYLAGDGWNEATALSNCQNQFGDGNGDLSSPSSCLSDAPPDRCIVTDDGTGNRYFAYGSSEGICTNTVGGTFETQPGDGWPAY